MTAPFTTDASRLEPRRLRSYPGAHIGLRVYQVGCGYALHDGGKGKLFVVRLSDGWAWFIPDVLGRDLQVPLGITCDELFAAANIDGKLTIARIRLDSLGPGVES